jgi:glycosyltransferase involved in cell wall biosynthesis
MTEFSVVIPTHRRPDTLFRVLHALGDQTAPPDFEVVVVDDGSGDGTYERLRGHRASYPLRAFSQENAGPAGARNRGIAEARGDVVLFLGDDTVPEPQLLSVHAAAHNRAAPDSIAVLGYTTWPRGRRVSPFLHHINEYGLQFGYSLIEDPESVPFNFFYTSNISLARRLLLGAGKFDTTFPHAAWEDIEIAYRLTKQGMRIVYRPDAVARHYHDITFRSFRRRQRRSGEAAAIFFEKHPELGDFLGVPQALRLADGGGPARKLRVWWASLAERWRVPGSLRALDDVLRADYLAGLAEALTERGWSAHGGPGSGTAAERPRTTGVWPR